MEGSLTFAAVFSLTGSAVVGPELAEIEVWFGSALIADTCHWTASAPIAAAGLASSTEITPALSAETSPGVASYAQILTLPTLCACWIAAAAPSPSGPAGAMIILRSGCESSSELMIWVDLVTSNWSYWVGSTWMSERCALTAASSGVYSSSTTGIPAMPPSTTTLPAPGVSCWRNCWTNGPPAVSMNVSVYSAAGVRAADAMTGAPWPIRVLTCVVNWLAEKGLMYRPSGLVSSAALKFCDIDCADVVVDEYHLRLTPSFLASEVPPHITVTQYGSVPLEITPARLMGPEALLFALPVAGLLAVVEDDSLELQAARSAVRLTAAANVSPFCPLCMGTPL